VVDAVGGERFSDGISQVTGNFQGIRGKNGGQRHKTSRMTYCPPVARKFPARNTREFETEIRDAVCGEQADLISKQERLESLEPRQRRGQKRHDSTAEPGGYAA